jgi:uncharacterized membrane protein YfcA
MEAGLLRDVLTLLLGLVTGVLSALFGIGGAIVSNPGLRVLGAAPLVAVGTTLPSILPGAVSGTLRYQREKLIDWRVVVPAAAAGLLAVVGGSLLSHAVPGEGHLLLLMIAVLLAFTAWRTATGGGAGGGAGGGVEGGAGGGVEGGAGGGVEGGAGGGAVDDREHPTSPSATLPLRGTSQRGARYSRARPAGAGGEAGPAGAGGGNGPAGAGGANGPAGAGGGAEAGSTGDDAGRAGAGAEDSAGPGRWMAAGIGVAAGLLSGLLGIGGGVIMVPAFTELLGLSLKSAIATSLVCVGIFGVPATVTHALLGDIDWRLAVLLTVGVVPGARIGASLTIRTSERRLRLAVGCFLALVALVYFVTETRALLALSSS